MDSPAVAILGRQVAALIERLLGERPQRVAHMAFGHSSVTFDVALPGGDVIVRTNRRAATFAHTADNLDTLRALGLPVPRVIAADLTREEYPFAYLLLEKIPGEALRYALPAMTAPQLARLAGQIVDFQRRVATLPEGGGFGWAPIGVAADFPSWRAVLDYELRRAVAGAPDNNLVAAVARIERAIERHATYLAAIRPTCFLDDVTTKNVIIEAGVLRGLIDFDVVCYGDPLYHLGLTTTAIVSDLGPESLFYAEELGRQWSLTASQRQIVALYAAIHALDFVRRMAVDAGGAWHRRMAAALDGWLDCAQSGD